MRTAKSRQAPKKEAQDNKDVFVSPDVVICNFGASAEENEECAKKFLCLVKTENEVEQRKASTGSTYMLLARQLVSFLLKRKNVKFDPYGEFGFSSTSGYFIFDGIEGQLVKTKGQ
jgi:hypothetical protein